MGWALLGVGLFLALYTLIRHGLRRAPPPRARPALHGRTAIVTGERRAPRAAAPVRYGPAWPCPPLTALLRSAGGSGGIGAATALELARCGARVILATRSALRGEAAARRIRTVSTRTPSGDTPCTLGGLSASSPAPPWDMPVHHMGTLMDAFRGLPWHLPSGTPWILLRHSHGTSLDISWLPSGDSQDNPGHLQRTSERQGYPTLHHGVPCARHRVPQPTLNTAQPQNTLQPHAPASDPAPSGSPLPLARPSPHPEQCAPHSVPCAMLCCSLQETGNSEVQFMQLDLSSLQSVRAFASAFLRQEPHLHLLINNAGEPWHTPNPVPLP